MAPVVVAAAIATVAVVVVNLWIVAVVVPVAVDYHCFLHRREDCVYPLDRIYRVTFASVTVVVL